VLEDLLHLLKASERLSWECVEPVVGSTIQTGWEHMTQEQVVVRVDCYLVLVLTDVLDGVSHSRVALEAQHHKLLWEAVRSGFL